MGALLAAIVLIAGAAQAYDLQFSATPGSQIIFSGGSSDTFQFVPASGSHAFIVTSPSPNLLADYVGDITGTFQIGAVSVAGPLQSASVSTIGGDAYFKLYKPGAEATDYLTAKLHWDTINTYDLYLPAPLPGSTFGGVGGPAWSDVTLVGSDPGLTAIAGLGNANISFQFYPIKNLTQLTTTGGSTSFSGSVAAVPEPTTIAGLVGLGLVGLVAVLRRRMK
jgi:hypothetical protein